MKNLLLSVSAFIAAAFSLQADIPAGYYDDCIGKCESALKSQLYILTKSHTAISYNSGTWKAFPYTDQAPDGTWIDIYTFEHVDASGHSSMNIEHTFPKSWWGGAENNAYKDIVHLMPVDQWANNDRSNYPYGEVDVEKAPNYRCPSPNYKLGKPVEGQGGGSNYVFEPADEYKGDLARTYFYMVTCYQDLTWSAGGLQTAQQGIYPTLQPWAQELLLKWHRQDPVSDRERERNEGVYTCQNNRNPFIDHPEMVEHIWGNLSSTPWNENETPGPGEDPDPQPNPAILTSPSPDVPYSFSCDEPGEYARQTVHILGSNFTSSLKATITGPDASMFALMLGNTALPAMTLTATDINSAEGIKIGLRYAPTASTGEALHSAFLTLSGSDLTDDMLVPLKGECRLSFVPEISTNLPSDASFFTIDGRALPAEPSAHGIYIMIHHNKAQKIFK